MGAEGLRGHAHNGFRNTFLTWVYPISPVSYLKLLFDILCVSLQSRFLIPSFLGALKRDFDSLTRSIMAIHMPNDRIWKNLGARQGADLGCFSCARPQAR